MYPWIALQSINRFIIRTYVQIHGKTFAVHRTTVKKEPIHTISYELYPYMPRSIFVLLIQFMLLLLRACKIFQPAIVKYYFFDAFIFLKIPLALIFCSAQWLSCALVTTYILSQDWGASVLLWPQNNN